MYPLCDTNKFSRYDPSFENLELVPFLLSRPVTELNWISKILRKYPQAQPSWLPERWKTRKLNPSVPKEIVPTQIQNKWWSIEN